MAMWEPPDRFDLLGLEEANLLLLQTCLAVEEHPVRDPNEDLGPLAGEIARLDFKLNLVMQLLAKLVSKDRMPPATPIQCSTAWVHPWTCIGQTPPLGVPWPAARAAAQLAAAAAGTAGAGGRGRGQPGDQVKFPELSAGVAELIRAARVRAPPAPHSPRCAKHAPEEVLILGNMRRRTQSRYVT
jgi:hypothetical protein